MNLKLRATHIRQLADDVCDAANELTQAVLQTIGRDPGDPFNGRLYALVYNHLGQALVQALTTLQIDDKETNDA